MQEYNEESLEYENVIWVRSVLQFTYEKAGEQNLETIFARYDGEDTQSYKNGQWCIMSVSTIMELDPDSFSIDTDFVTDRQIKSWLDKETGEKIQMILPEDTSLLTMYNNSHLEPITEVEINNKDYLFPERIFRDIAPSNELFEMTKQAQSSGWISGYSDGTFQPDNTVNRAEFAKMLTLAFDLTTNSDKEITEIPANLEKFADVKGEWYVPYLSSAVENEVMQGYGDGSMKPSNTIVQAEALAMVLRVAGVNIDKAEEDETWYQPYYEYAEENLDLSFLTEDSLKEEMTRGESVELISECLEL